MALHYLSGDDSEMGKSKAKTEKKAANKSAKAAKPKKVAKVALAPARASFLAVTELNLLRLGTKLARTWKSDGGKNRLTTFWKNFGGDPAKLQKAIAKGSKQTISGSQMGAVGAAIATATPIIIAVAKIISDFKAGGDDKEKKEFDDGVNQGKKDLGSDTDVEKTDQNMPEGKDVALVKKKAPGEATPLGMNTNPLSICFFLLMMMISFHSKNLIVISICAPFILYALIGFIVIPFSEFGIAGTRIKKIFRNYFDIPAKWFFSITNYFYHGKA